MPAYSTKPGDTLTSIAQNAGTTPQDLQKLNPSLSTITDPNQQFSSSMVLNLPEPQVSTPQPNLSTPQGQAFATPTGQVIPTGARQPAKPQQPAITSGSAEAQGQKPPQNDLQAQLAGIQKQAETIQKALQSSGQDITSGSVARDIAGEVDVSAEPTGAQVELEKLKNLYKTQPPATQSIQDYYNDLADKEGLPALDTKIVNLENVMNGTEQDIRNEIQSGGGFATESQVQALVGARNKTLTIQLNNLLDLRKQRADYINNQVSLKQADAKTAAENFDKQIGYQEKITTLQNTIDNSGFKQTMAYQTYVQKEQGMALKQLDVAMKQGATLSENDIAYYSEMTGIDSALLRQSNTNAAAKFQVSNQLNSARAMYYDAGFANLTPADISNLATMFMGGYPIQNLFKGLAANGYIGQVLNEATTRLGASGGTIMDVATNQAAYKGLTAAMTQQQKQLGAVDGYEQRVKEQVPLVKSALSDYLKATGNNSESVAFNDAYQAITGKITGVKAQQIAKFQLALNRMATEWAKVTSGSMGSAELSNYADKKMGDLLSSAYGPKTLEGLVDYMLKDMEANKKGLEIGISNIQDNIKNLSPDTGLPVNVSSSVNDYVNSLNLPTK